MDGRMDNSRIHKERKRIKNEVELIEQYENRDEYNFIKRKIIECKFRNYIKNKPKSDFELRSTEVDVKV